MECTSCRKKEDLTHFSIRNNGVKCNICSKSDKSVIEISNSTLYAIRYIVMSNPKKLFSFNIPDASIEELKLISKIYLDEKLEKS